MILVIVIPLLIMALIVGAYALGYKDGRLSECEDQTFTGLDALTKKVEAPKAGIGLRHALPFGDGDYSCAVCGCGMKEPCEHWKRFLAQGGTPAVLLILR